MTWTPERIERLKHLWTVEGLSMSQIGAELRVTKNMVAGKLHRMRLRGEDRPGPSAPARPRRPNPSRHIPQRPATLADIAIEEPATEADIDAFADPHFTPDNKDLLDLTKRSCRWPYGDPDQPDFHFCGAKSLAGRPYCAAHHKVAYVGASNDR